MPQLKHAESAWFVREGSDEHKELESRWPLEGLMQYRFYIDNGYRLFTKEGIDVAHAVGAFCLEAGRLDVPISKALPMPRPWPFSHNSQPSLELIVNEDVTAQAVESAIPESLSEVA